MRNPNTALARYHLAVALARKGDSNNARVEYRRFIDTWKQADLDIAELRQAENGAAPIRRLEIVRGLKM